MLVPFLLFIPFFSLRMFQYYLFHPIFTSDFDQKSNCCFIFELKNVFLFWGTLMDALSGATGSTLGCKGTEALLSWAIFYRTRCGGYSRDFCEPTSCWPSVSVIWNLRASMITCIPWRYVRQDLRHAFSICFSYVLRAVRPVVWFLTVRGSLVALWCIGVLAVRDNSSVKMLNLYFSDYLIF